MDTEIIVANAVLLYIAGLVTGMILSITFIKFGFKLSAEIRSYKGDVDVESLLFNPKKDPVELSLQEEIDKKERKGKE